MRRAKGGPASAAEKVIRRIAAECADADERGGVVIRLEPAADDRAARRGTIPPAAGAQANALVAETGAAGVIAVGPGTRGLCAKSRWQRDWSQSHVRSYKLHKVMVNFYQCSFR